MPRKGGKKFSTPLLKADFEWYMKWGSAWKVLQISDYKGETAKPKPFIKGMLETINQSYFYIESLILR